MVGEECSAKAPAKTVSKYELQPNLSADSRICQLNSWFLKVLVIMSL